MHGAEYLELRRNLATADLATNGDALPKPNTFTRLDELLIKSLTGSSQRSLARLTEKPRSKPQVARKVLEMVGQDRQGRKGVTQLNRSKSLGSDGCLPRATMQGGTLVPGISILRYVN